MVNKKIEQFVEQIKADTITKKLHWTVLSFVPKDFINMSENLQSIMADYAHNIVLTAESYRANDHKMGALYLIKRRIQSGKDGSIDNTLTLYVQKHELDNCIPVDVSATSLIELETIIRNINSNNDVALDKELDDYITNYLDM